MGRPDYRATSPFSPGCPCGAPARMRIVGGRPYTPECHWRREPVIQLTACHHRRPAASTAFVVGVFGSGARAPSSSHAELRAPVLHVGLILVLRAALSRRASVK